MCLLAPLAFALLSACSNGGGGSPPPAAPEQYEIPADVPLPAGSLTVSGISQDAFNPTTATVVFELANSTFDTAPDALTLLVNGLAVDPTTATATDARIDVPVTFESGRNTVSLHCYDVLSRPIFFAGVYWCGDNQLTVQLVDENQSPLAVSADVGLSLSDDPDVRANGATAPGSGAIVFDHVPNRTVVVEARTSTNLVGVGGGLGNAGVVDVPIVGFAPPSPIANNDISLGTDGWTFAPGTVAVVPHTEGAPGSFFGFGGTDNDLQLTTSGEGPQSLSRTFTLTSGATSASLRYRFITSEVPGGYFGSEFNDYFSVSVRSQSGGQIANESNTMNGLGLDAFDFASGATDWRVVVLEVDPLDTVQVDVTVANVGDGAFDSQVVVDLVEELEEPVRPGLAWNPSNGGLTLSWTVEATLTEEVPIAVYWASSDGYVDRIGEPLFTTVVPAGTGPSSGSELIAGTTLADDPTGATHLLASTSETNTVALADVAIGYGANANAAVVADAMLDIVRDGLRTAGQASATITSTARSASDQARAMFQNLTSPANTIAQNIQNQLALYGSNGDQVIAVFEQEVVGLTRTQVLAAQTAIRAAMTTRIEELGPSNVSRHCADPTEVSVIDIGLSAFSGNAPLFRASVRPRVTVFLDEPNNNAYHLQLDL